MVPDLLQAFQIIPQLHIKSIGNDLRVLSILVILLPIQKPVWDFELTRVGNNSHQIVQLSCTQFPSSLVHVDIGLLADEVGEAATDTFDGGESEHDFLLSIHICVQHTKDVLKILVCHQRHFAEDTTARLFATDSVNV